ncbi:MAG: DedA family protein [Patescibacteria group bacterium]|nr:DedA family protein [Patescibacteria group bacterium]
MADFFTVFLDLFLHLDQHLFEVVNLYGFWVYPILFAVIFFETGIVVTPFLPGDSLLFAAGTLAAITSLRVYILWPLLWFAAVLGDTVNYWVGQRLGEVVFRRYPRWFKPKHLERTKRFYDKYGSKTIVLARFFPIIRTLAPFVAGVGRMKYRRFFAYNVLGGFIWTTLFIFGGFFFGNIPFIKRNFEWAILIIIATSFIPALIEYWRHRGKRKTTMPIVGITGTIGAGKGTIAEYLVKHYGFGHYSARAFIVEEIERRGLEVSRDNMLAVANQLREEHGADYVIRSLFKRAAKVGVPAVIESVRSRGEVQFIHENNGKILAIDAPVEVRHKRVQLRKSVTDQVTLEQFLKAERAETHSDGLSQSNLLACIQLADKVLDNSDDLAFLYSQIDRIVSDWARLAPNWLNLWVDRLKAKE